jgi:hypothetical protein
MLQEQCKVANFVWVFSVIGKNTLCDTYISGGPCTRGSPGAGGRHSGVVS